MDTRVSTSTEPSRNTQAWLMLGASTLAQVAASIAANGASFLIPALHRDGRSLAHAGLVASAPLVGIMVTLVAWGYVIDKIGERTVLIVGLVGGAIFSGLAIIPSNLVVLAILLGLAGAATACTNAAGGRVVVGWFPPERRGLAMGIRQMAQPVGVGLAALTMPTLSLPHGVGTAMWVPTIMLVVSLIVVVIVVVDPARPTRTAESAPNPYRGSNYVTRIHLVSLLLVIPQFLVWTYALLWLLQERHWSTGAAGALILVAQILGAFGRVASGQLSDSVGSRMKPLLWISAAAAVTMAAFGVTAWLGWWLAVVVMVIATVVTVADNGLAFTAIAERAGPFWSGRALGVQNTGQYLMTIFVPPVAGLAIEHASFAWTFGLSALFPLIALPLVPHRDEERR